MKYAQATIIVNAIGHFGNKLASLAVNIVFSWVIVYMMEIVMVKGNAMAMDTMDVVNARKLHIICRRTTSAF